MSKFSDLYLAKGLKPLRFYEIKYKSFWDNEKDILLPGFFTPFQSGSDFRNQVKVPLVTPVVCLFAALKDIVNLVQSSLLTVLNLCLLDPKQAWNETKNAGQSFKEIFSDIGHAVIDTLYAVLALVCRTLSTLISGLVSVANGLDYTLGKGMHAIRACAKAPAAPAPEVGNAAAFLEEAHGEADVTFAEPSVAPAYI